MKLEEIILKSRSLVDKLRKNEEAIFTKEDYFMICVSLFIAKKEKVIKKDNKTNTLHFDYKKDNKEYFRMDLIFDRMLMEEQCAMVNIPGLGEFDLTRTGCFDGIENLYFPFNLKIEIENFEGTLNELNEVKRIMWIYSKLRDSFVHGEKFEFDFSNNKIKINNCMSNDILGSFQFIISFNPKVLGYLCGQTVQASENIYYGNHDLESYERIHHLQEMIAQDSEILIDEVMKEIDDINSKNELKIINTILIAYRKAYNELSQQQRDEYLDKIVEVIVTFAGRNRRNNRISKELIKKLSSILSTEDNNYHAALYSHMIFVFSNAENIDSRNIKTTYFQVENDDYKRILLKAIKNANKSFQSLLNAYLDPIKTRDAIASHITKIMHLIEMRNKQILNSLRNGIMHTNITITDSGIEIVDKVDNTKNDSEISFKCRTTFEQMDKFLQEIETEEKQKEDLDVDEFIEEIKAICGSSQPIELFALYLRTLNDYIYSKSFNDSELDETDEPPKF